MKLKPLTGQLLITEEDDAKTVATLFSNVIENMDVIIKQQGGHAAWHMLDVEVGEEEYYSYGDAHRQQDRVIYLTVPVAYV